jgi:aminoglycoside phosphotransferase (APT) family kinase protein
MVHDEFLRFQRLIHEVAPGSRLRSLERLTGGVSAELTALELELPDGIIEKVVVRCYGERDLAQNPDVATDEYRLLEILQLTSIPVPRPRLVDAQGHLMSRPCLVIDYIDGSTESAPDEVEPLIDRLSEVLSEIHSIDPGQVDLSFLPRATGAFDRVIAKTSEAPDETLSERQIRDALASVWPMVQVNASTLLHGDCWPGNVLWRDGDLVAVVDWEDAAVGDPLVDLANARLEALWLYGPEAMKRFTDQYLNTNPIDLGNLPYWDLCVALRPVSQLAGWGLEPETEQLMRERHRYFVDKALSRLSCSR